MCQVVVKLEKADQIEEWKEGFIVIAVSKGFRLFVNNKDSGSVKKLLFIL